MPRKQVLLTGVNEAPGMIPVADGGGGFSWTQVAGVSAPTGVTWKPWLGLNGNHLATSSFAGNQTQFSQYGIVYTRLEQQQGQVNDGDGVPLLTGVATCSGIGQIPVILIEPSAYDTGAAYPSGGAINSYGNYFVSTMQSVESAYPFLGCLYEVDNEPWNFYTPGATAAQYAAVVVWLLGAAQTAGLDLTRIYVAVKDASWVQAMYTAQPSLKTLVQGWTMHPYGMPPPAYAASTGQGIAAVPHLRQTITGSGFNNILISEIGLYDNSVAGASLSTSFQSVPDGNAAAVAMGALLEQAGEYHAEGWLKALLIYHRTDSGFAMVQVNTSGTLTPAGQALIDYPNGPRPVPTRAFSPRAPGLWQPYDDGLVAATMDPAMAHDSIQLTAGKIHFFRLRSDIGDYYQNIIFWLDTSGSTLTASQCWAGIYWQGLDTGASGYQLYESALDTHGIWTNVAGSTGVKLLTSFGNDYLQPGYWWIAMLANGTTMPKFRGVLKGDQMNLKAAAPWRNMISQASFTTLPATIDLSNSSTVVSQYGSGILVAVSP